MSYIMLELAYGFQKRLAFNITDSPAHLNNGNLGVFTAIIPVKPAFDFIRNMRDDLDCAAAEIAAAFLDRTDQYTLPVVTLDCFVRRSSMKRS